jgi:hypothetical protein
VDSTDTKDKALTSTVSCVKEISSLSERDEPAFRVWDETSQETLDGPSALFRKKRSVVYVCVCMCVLCICIQVSEGNIIYHHKHMYIYIYIHTHTVPCEKRTQ